MLIFVIKLIKEQSFFIKDHEFCFWFLYQCRLKCSKLHLTLTQKVEIKPSNYSLRD